MLPPCDRKLRLAASAAEDGNGVWVALSREEDVEDEVMQQGLQKTGSFRGSRPFVVFLPGRSSTVGRGSVAKGMIEST